LTDWLDELEPVAPDPIGAYRNIDAGRFLSVRREVRRRAGVGTAPVIVQQLAALAGALDAIVARLPEEAFAAPGGEGDWNVAEAIGHVAHARAGARSIDGHELDPCPLEHPWVGRLRCGEWLLFAGVHDLMHLEQLHELEARFG
jgi:hypothetical protein